MLLEHKIRIRIPPATKSLKIRLVQNYMMRQIGIHDYDEIAPGVFDSVDVSRSESQLLFPRPATGF